MNRPLNHFARKNVIVALVAAWTSTSGIDAAAIEGSDWELVRSVSSRYSGTIDLVLIPERKQGDREYYLKTSAAVCGDRTFCMVNFWTDRAHIPTSAQMPVPDLAVMTATYERHPNYKQPVLHLACWLYPSREVGEFMKCSYFPGAKVPWEMPQTPVWAK